MIKNIRFYTIAVLFDRQVTPKVNRCLCTDIRYSTLGLGLDLGLGLGLGLLNSKIIYGAFY